MGMNETCVKSIDSEQFLNGNEWGRGTRLDAAFPWHDTMALSVMDMERRGVTYSSNRNYTTLKERGGYDERSKTICDMSMHKELSVKSRVRVDFHAWFCERVRAKLPRSTRSMTRLNTIYVSSDNLLFSLSLCLCVQ